MHLSPSLITWLRSFEAAARHGSFTRASVDLHLTQSAVSQQVRHLEVRLDCQLFHRLARRLELTDYGQRLFKEVAPALRCLEQAVSNIRAPAAMLHVSCSPSFANRWLMPRLGRFLRLHPEIDLNLRAEYHALTRDSFVREGLDVAIRYDPLAYPDLDAENLMNEYLLPVASRDLAPSRAADLGAVDFTGLTLLYDSEPWDGAPENIEWQTLFPGLNRLGIDSFRTSRFNLAELALASACAGEGVAAARLALSLDDLESCRLVPVAENVVLANSRYVFLSAGTDDPRVTALLAWLREECESFRVRRGQFLAELAKGISLTNPASQ